MKHGSYFSLLYENTEEFLDIVAAFFDAGFRNNECCLWGVSGQLDADNARELLKDAGIDADKYLEKGQLIISPCSECYIAGEGAVSERGLRKWSEILNDAISNGYDGLRIIDRFTIVSDDGAWKQFAEYQEKAAELIKSKNIVAIFAFLMEARTRPEIIEIISMHDGTIIKRKERWTLLQSSSSCKTIYRESHFPDNMLENVWTGVWAVDKHDNIVYFNKGMESISGLPKSDVLGKKLAAFIPHYTGMDEQGFITVFQSAKKSLQSRNYDIFPFVRPDGQFIYHSGFLLPLADGQGKYMGMLGTIGKLIEQKLNAEFFRDRDRSLKKLEDIYRKSPVVAFLWTAEENWPIAFVSENISQFGYSQEDLIGNTGYGDLIHPDDLEIVRNDVSQLEQKGKMFFSKEYRIRSKPGDYIWVLESSYLIRDEKGKPAYYQGIIVDISERKKAEEAALEAEKKYRLIFENSPLGLFHFDENTVITHCNEKFLKIMQLKSKDDIIGFNLMESVVDRDMKKAVNDAMSRKQGFFEGEYHTVSTNVTISIKAYYSPNISDDGTFLGGIGVFEDISERRKAEYAMIEAEKKHRLIFENSPLGIFHFDSNGNVTHCNEKYLQIIGLEKKEEVIGFNMLTCIRDKMMQKAINDVFSRKPGHFEGKYHTVISGKDVYLKADYSPNIGDDGTFLGGIGIFEDTSVRMKAEAALRLDESRLEALLKISQFSDTSLKGMADFVQEEAVRLTQSHIGYLAFLNDEGTVLKVYSWSKNIMKECKVKGKKLEYPLEDTGLWGEPIRQKKAFIVNDFSAPNPNKHGYPAGHITLRRYLSIPIFDGGNVVGAAGVGNKETDYDQSDVRQLTLFMEGMWRLIQRKEAEETLREYADKLSFANEELSKANAELSDANEELKSLDLMKDEFLSNVSHEFKTPLTSIQGYSQLIADETLGPVNEHQKKAVDTVIRNSERLRRLVDSLLYMSRTQSGKLSYLFGPVKIEDVLDNSIHDLALQAEGKNIEIRTDIQSDLPDINADRDKMMDVFVNLIDNAVKFTPQGGKVTVSARLSEDSVYITVEDTGIGIPRDKIPKLFQRFYQVDSSLKRRYGGTGLGLYICKKIVGDHNGDIYVTSEQGKGTTVHVKLPVMH